MVTWACSSVERSEPSMMVVTNPFIQISMPSSGAVGGAGTPGDARGGTDSLFMHHLTLLEHHCDKVLVAVGVEVSFWDH
jgi:hypothetical protein